MLENDELTFDLTRAARDGKLPPTLGRDKEIARLIELLGSGKGKCLLIVGQRGMGKRSVVHGLIAEAAANADLCNHSFLELNVGQLLSENVRVNELARDLLSSLKTHPSQIIFIDPCVPFIDASEQGSKLVSLYSEALRSSAIRAIATVDTDEYRRLKSSVPWVFETFTVLKLKALPKTDIRAVLEGLRPGIEKKQRVILSSGALDAAIDLSEQYLSDQGLPGIAVEVLNKACERYKRKSKTAHAGGDWLDKESIQMIGLKVSGHDVKRVVGELSALDIDADQISTWSRKLYKRLQKTVFAQEEANQKGAEAIAKSLLRVGASGRPLGMFLFVGQRGAGKNHAAQTLALNVAGSDHDVFVFDMLEYVSNTDVRRLFGFTPSTGGRISGCELDNAIQSAPIAYVILKNMEHAHQDVFDLLRQILETGVLKDRAGGKIKFRRCILMLLASYPESLKIPDNVSSKELMELAPKTFPKAICQGVDTIIPLLPISEKHEMEFVQRRLHRYIEMLKRQEVTLHLDSSVGGLVTKPGTGRFSGIAELKEAIRKTIRAPIDDALHANEPRRGLSLHVSADNGKAIVEVTRPA